MVKGKKPKGKIKKNKLGVRNRKSKKVRTRSTPPTGRRNARYRVNNLGLDAEQSLVEQAMRGSPDMEKLLRENNGELFVPNERPPSRMTLRNLYNKSPAFAAEHQFALMEKQRSSIPSPIVEFHEDLDKQQFEAGDDIFLADTLNEITGSDIVPGKGFGSIKGGKRKSRKRKSRRKRRRRRKTKRKSRRRRK